MSCERRMSVWWMESSDDLVSCNFWPHVQPKLGLCIVLLNLKLKKRLKYHGDSPNLNFIRLLRIVVTPSVRERLEAIG